MKKIRGKISEWKNLENQKQCTEDPRLVGIKCVTAVCKKIYYRHYCSSLLCGLADSDDIFI